MHFLCAHLLEHCAETPVTIPLLFLDWWLVMKSPVHKDRKRIEVMRKSNLVGPDHEEPSIDFVPTSGDEYSQGSRGYFRFDTRTDNADSPYIEEEIAETSSDPRWMDKQKPGMDEQATSVLEEDARNQFIDPNSSVLKKQLEDPHTLDSTHSRVVGK